MKKIIKKFIEFAWHYQQAYQMLTIPVSGFSVAISLFTFIAVAFDIRFLWWHYGLFLAGVVALGAWAGWLMKRAGFLMFLQDLNNKQNSQLMKINHIEEMVEKINASECVNNRSCKKCGVHFTPSSSQEQEVRFYDPMLCLECNKVDPDNAVGNLNHS